MQDCELMRAHHALNPYYLEVARLQGDARRAAQMFEQSLQGDIGGWRGARG